MVEWNSGEKTELDPETVVAFGLRTNLELDEAAYRSLREFDDKKKCLAAALNLISIRPRSVQELRARFLRKGYSEASVEENLAKLVDKGYLNDTEFARRFVKSLLQKKNIGKQALEFELRKKGIAPGIAEAALTEIYSERDEREDARAAANKKMHTYRGLENSKMRVKLSLFLRQRGFSAATINETVKKLLK